MTFRIVPREEWGSTGARGGERLQLPLADWIIHTWAGYIPTSISVDDSYARMRGVQRYHREKRGFSDIGYSLVIDPNGRILEGRGWGRSGAHTQGGGNYSGHGIGMMGHGDLQPFTPAQWDALEWLTLEGVRLRAIRNPWKVSGHRDWYPPKTCPGNLVYPEIHQRLDPETIGDDIVGCYDNVEGLKLGDTGQGVKELQLLLNLQGAGLLVDGDFGPRTEDAVYNFQAHNREAPSKIATKATVALLEKYAGGIVKPCDTAPLDLAAQRLTVDLNSASAATKTAVLNLASATEHLAQLKAEIAKHGG